MRQAVPAASGDIGARYGGEEFAIVLPNTDAEGALYVAHAVREAVAACAIAHDRAPMGHVTIRIGVASAANGGNPAALVARADQALYQAKGAAGTAWFLSGERGGRNCVVHADPALLVSVQEAPKVASLHQPSANARGNRDCGQPRCIDTCYDDRQCNPLSGQAQSVLKAS
jgi:predicted signal transduction protein with EAL and GGDEF domain